MPAPVLIDYSTFLAEAQPADVRALAVLAGNELIKTQDAAEADAYQALGVRLYNAGCTSRFRRSLEVIGDQTWHVFDARVVPAALVYVANAASAYLTHVQNPQP